MNQFTVLVSWILQFNGVYQLIRLLSKQNMYAYVGLKNRAFLIKQFIHIGFIAVIKVIQNWKLKTEFVFCFSWIAVASNYSKLFIFTKSMTYMHIYLINIIFRRALSFPHISWFVLHIRWMQEKVSIFDECGKKLPSM